MYFSGASAGLVFISVAADLGRQEMGQWAFVVVVVLSFGNAMGRVIIGYVSDKLGRELTLFAVSICQAMVIGFLYFVSSHGGLMWAVILPVVCLIGFNYGANLTLFPSICRDYFGMRSFGLNYGCLFAAFGTAGLVMPTVNGMIRDYTGKQDISYVLIITLLLVSAGLALISHLQGPPVLCRKAEE